MYLNVISILQYGVCIYIYIEPKQSRSSRSIHDVSKFTGTFTSPPTPPKPRSSRSIHDVSKFTGTLTSPPPHPNSAKFTKHTWREQVHRTLTSPATPPKPRSSRTIHDVSKFTGTLTSPPPQTLKKAKKKVWWPDAWGRRWVLKAWSRH